MKARRHADGRRRSIALIWTVLVMMLLVGLLGLSLDTARAMLASQQLQAAADGAALAAVRLVRTDIPAARAKAVEIAGLNHTAGDAVQLDPNPDNLPDGDVVVGTFSRLTSTFTPTEDGPNAVMINARRTDSSLGGRVSLIFGPVFGTDSVNVSRQAIAMHTVELNGSGFVVLNPTEARSLELLGNAILTVDGPIQVNSTNAQAVWAHNWSEIYAPELNTCGGVYFDMFGGGPTFTGVIHTGTSPIADPLSGLPEPDWSSWSLPTVSSATYNHLNNNRPSGIPVVINPGYYPNGLRVTDHSWVKMSPGLYIFNSLASTGAADEKGVYVDWVSRLDMGPGIVVMRGSSYFHTEGGDSQVNANGVMVFLAETSQLLFDGRAFTTINPPQTGDFSGAGTYQGIAVFQGRLNTNQLTIKNNAHYNGGALYLCKGKLYVGFSNDTYGGIQNQYNVIADRITLDNASRLNLTSAGGLGGDALNLRDFLVK